MVAYEQPYFVAHCNLCALQEIDLVRGAQCGATGKTPDFQQRCSRIELAPSLDKLIEEIQVESLVFKSRFIPNVILFCLIVLFGVAVIYLGWWSLYELERKGALATMPFGIMGVGLLIVASGVGPFRKFIMLTKAVNRRLKQVESTLLQYGVRYSNDIKLGREIHGVQQYSGGCHRNS